MDTHERIATNPTRALNVVAHIIAKIVLTEGTRQQNAPCVEEITRQTTKVVSIIIILSKETIHTEPPLPEKARYQYPLPHTTITHLLRVPHHNNAVTLTQSATVHNSEEPIITLKAILEDFKGLFAQLIQQNSLILNVLTTILNKPH